MAVVHDKHYSALFLLNRARGQFSQVVAMPVNLFVCLSVPLPGIANSAEIDRVLVFCHNIDCISIFLDCKSQR